MISRFGQRHWWQYHTDSDSRIALSLCPGLRHRHQHRTPAMRRHHIEHKAIGLAGPPRHGEYRRHPQRTVALDCQQPVTTGQLPPVITAHQPLTRTLPARRTDDALPKLDLNLFGRAALLHPVTRRLIDIQQQAGAVAALIEANDGISAAAGRPTHRRRQDTAQQRQQQAAEQHAIPATPVRPFSSHSLFLSTGWQKYSKHFTDTGISLDQVWPTRRLFF